MPAKCLQMPIQLPRTLHYALALAFPRSFLALRALPACLPALPSLPSLPCLGWMAGWLATAPAPASVLPHPNKAVRKVRLLGRETELQYFGCCTAPSSSTLYCVPDLIPAPARRPSLLSSKFIHSHHCCTLPPSISGPSNPPYPAAGRLPINQCPPLQHSLSPGLYLHPPHSALQPRLPDAFGALVQSSQCTSLILFSAVSCSCTI